MNEPVNKGYVLADSWYSCKDIFNISKKSKVRYIYDAAANGRPIEKIFESLKIAY